MKNYFRCCTVAAILFSAGLSFAVLTPLPSGAGLASAYPGDNGITANTAVLFHDNFESYSGSTLSWSAGIGDWDNAYGTLTVSRTASEVHAGSQCVRVNHTSSLGTHGADMGGSGSGWTACSLRIIRASGSAP